MTTMPETTGNIERDIVVAVRYLCSLTQEEQGAVYGRLLVATERDHGPERARFARECFRNLGVILPGDDRGKE